MSYEYLMQAVLLIVLLIAAFPAIILWSKWKKKKRG
ncbi:FeoB-associated Cys-rich membrane protein [Paenibacillus filicis]|uniref:FeoB-associated Cys-rich membrane protein n=1 Tax=Paenibacillus filicis TaxID=669464 RepID=A0ABU9DEJ3_9BACL